MNVTQHIMQDLIEQGINHGEHINGIRDISEITKSVSSTMQISSDEVAAVLFSVDHEYWY